MAAIVIRTQISSKYSPDNFGLFPFKQRMRDAGVEISYPVGDSIIDYVQGFAITVDHERTVPFPLTEIDFLESIVHSNVQVTYNVFGDQDGYVGESTAIESVFALQAEVPTILVRPIESFSPTLDPAVRTIIERVADQLIVIPLDSMPPSQIRSTLAEVILTRPSVALLPLERAQISIATSALTNKYAEAWSEFQRQTPAG